jgi:hypothetical protein
MTRVLEIILSLVLLTSCSADEAAGKPTAQIALTGSYQSVQYLFEVFSDKRLQITTADYISYSNFKKHFTLNMVREQKTVVLSPTQFDNLLNATRDFIDEDSEKMNLHLELPAPCFNIIAISAKKHNELDGSLFVHKDERGYYQSESTEKMKLVLAEISPIPIIYVRAQD